MVQAAHCLAPVALYAASTAPSVRLSSLASVGGDLVGAGYCRKTQGSVAYPASDLSSSNPARLPIHPSLLTMQTSCSAFNGAAVVSKAATNKGAPD